MILLSLMPRDRLKKESLAIGISGNWGSGKTSFLKSMQKRMNADYRVVTFNPWTCTDKEQIISQFFAKETMNIAQNFISHFVILSKICRITAVRRCWR